MLSAVDGFAVYTFGPAHVIPFKKIENRLWVRGSFGLTELQVWFKLASVAYNSEVGHAWAAGFGLEDRHVRASKGFHTAFFTSEQPS